DIFVGIVGQRHGSGPPGATESFTEIEYGTARTRGLPRFMFMATSDFPIPASLIESDEHRARLARFRQQITSSETVVFFDDEKDLAIKVSEAFHNYRGNPASNVPSE